MLRFFAVILVASLVIFPVMGQPSFTPTNPASLAASSINSIGVDLLHQTGRTGANALISPYSIETALTMAYAGADGQTREEMARVLHLGGDDAQTFSSFAKLQRGLDELVKQSAESSENMKRYGGDVDPITLSVANRLFGEKDYQFRAAFLDLLKTNYNAPLEAVDFRTDAAGVTKNINDWVAQQTRDRIRDLIPNGALDALTRLVIVNAVYLKAPWADPFKESATKPLPFFAGPGAPANVPTMSIQTSFGYAKSKGVTVVTIPYSGGRLQFLIILPDDTIGLAKVEAGLTADQLIKWSNLPEQEVMLYLPKFKIEPPTLPLGEALQTLGMTTAFDKPRGSANFDRMAPRRPPDDYLYISRVLHKTFLSVDEKGTEAAAATAVAMVALGIAMQPPKPIEVRVDHPFIFAIQHKATGACLFLGHVANPRLTNL